MVTIRTAHPGEERRKTICRGLDPRTQDFFEINQAAQQMEASDNCSAKPHLEPTIIQDLAGRKARPLSSASRLRTLSKKTSTLNLVFLVKKQDLRC